MPMTFSPEIRARASDQALFDDFERLYVQVAALRIARIDPEVSPVARVPDKVVALLQSGLRRVLELAEGFVREVNAGSFAPTFVLARASVETGCLLYDFADRAERVATTRDVAAIEEFDQRILKALLGAKSAEWKPDPAAPEALNVLTIIDHLTKRFPQLRSLYDLLSEFAHPNYDGMVRAYHLPPIEGVSVFEDHPAPASRMRSSVTLAVRGATLGLLLTRDAIDLYASVQAAFIRLCEEHIHGRGEWPKDVPYPRQV